MLFAAQHGLRDLELPDAADVDVDADEGDSISPRPVTSTIPQQIGPFAGRTALLGAIAARIADPAVVAGRGNGSSPGRPNGSSPGTAKRIRLGTAKWILAGTAKRILNKPPV